MSLSHNLSEARSSLNERLHPRIDPSDKYDGMHVRFQSHLRRVAEPTPNAQFVDRGKHFAIANRGHDNIADTQLHHMQPRETTILNSSLQTTRFHHGFRRNMEGQHNFYQKTESARESQTARKLKGIEHNREIYYSRRPELRGGGENVSSSSNCLDFSAALKPIVAMEAKSDARIRKIQNDSKHSPFDPPPPPPVMRSVSNRRRDLVAREGLTSGRKKQDIRDVFQSFDGYDVQQKLPQISTARKTRIANR